jgi:hypothetical protein
MKIDITYRRLERGGLVVLRVRFRQKDGQSAARWFPNPESFLELAAAAGICEDALNQLQEDANIVWQVDDRTHYRHEFEMTPDQVSILAGTSFASPQRFSLSFTTEPGDANCATRCRLIAKEWNTPPGQMPLEVSNCLSVEEAESSLKRIRLRLADIRDRDLASPQVNRMIDEDQVESLFDPTKEADSAESSDLGISLDL